MIHPTGRLAALAAAVALVAAGLAWVGTPVRGGWVALALVVPAAVDLALLLRLRPGTVTWPPVLVGELRRPLDLAVTVIGARAARVTLSWPPALGGPVPAARTRRRMVRTVLRWRVVPQRRGSFEPGPVWVFRAGPLSLWARREVHPAPCRVHVLPDLHGPADDVLARELSQVLDRPTRGRVASASEIEGLRAFAPGDDPRHIDWKATARRGTPIVRVFQPDQRRTVLVALDAGRLMRAEHRGESKLDAAVRAVARLGLAAERLGDAVGVVVFADAVVAELPPLHAAGQAARLVRGLADVVPRGVGSDLGRAVPRLLAARGSLVLTITDVLDGASARALTGPLEQLGRTHVPVVVLLRDPALDEAIGARVERAEDAWRRAAAELVGRERAEAVGVVRGTGVPVLDLSVAGVAHGVVGAWAEARRGAERE